mgnify:FL=1|tara:strand:- start:20 stop:199 length:180 start_codon:yes stop_codon:yes gene_type:complete
MTIKVNMMLTLRVDPEEYPIPSDERLDEELQDYITDLIHEIDGIKITNMRTIMENKNYD